MRIKFLPIVAAVFGYAAGETPKVAAFGCYPPYSSINSYVVNARACESNQNSMPTTPTKPWPTCPPPSYLASLPSSSPSPDEIVQPPDGICAGIIQSSWMSMSSLIDDEDDLPPMSTSSGFQQVSGVTAINSYNYNYKWMKWSKNRGDSPITIYSFHAWRKESAQCTVSLPATSEVFALLLIRSPLTPSLPIIT